MSEWRKVSDGLPGSKLECWFCFANSRGVHVWHGWFDSLIPVNDGERDFLARNEISEAEARIGLFYCDAGMLPASGCTHWMPFHRPAPPA